MKTHITGAAAISQVSTQNHRVVSSEAGTIRRPDCRGGRPIGARSRQTDTIRMRNQQ